jgi:phage/plasmid-like protein (TIGR03299 family)
MPANLATTDSKPAMMYTGDVPWHRLGTRLDSPPTAREAIVASGLDYRVAIKELATVDQQEVPQRKAVVRCDTGDVLGVVGNSYVPVQNHQAFGFLDAVVADAGLRYHTAGALGKGERIWMLAKLPGAIQVGGSDDLVDKFLLLSNTHDGTTALRVFFTPIRVVCQNTLNLAERLAAGQGIAIMHKGDLHTKIQEAQRVLGLATRFYDDAAARIDLLASHQPSAEQLTSFFESVYPDPVGADPTRARNIRETLGRLFETGIGLDMPGVRGTTWAAYNAVTEWVDHHRPTRARHPAILASRRLESSWFGSGAKLKARAWGLAVDMALGG